MFHLSDGFGKLGLYYKVREVNVIPCPNIPDRCSVDKKGRHLTNTNLYETREEIPPPDYEEILLEVYAQYGKAARNPFPISTLVNKGWRVKTQRALSYNPPEAILVMK